jgi:Ca2+-binding RTX toxin-like protein
MANLVGGSGVDTFKFSGINGKVLSLNDGGSPAGKGDWLNYAAFGSATTVTVDLDIGSATNVNGGVAGAVTGIQNVLGRATGTSSLTGSAQGNILIGGSGTNTLAGVSGNSLLIGGSGHGAITGGSGIDILIAGTTTYSAATTAGQNSLMAILAELQSADSFAQKVYDLIHGTDSGDPNGHGSDLNGSNKLTWGVSGATVKASSEAFTLSGDASAETTAD